MFLSKCSRDALLLIHWATVYIGFQNVYSAVVLLLYSLVPHVHCRSPILSLFLGHPEPCLACVKGLLLRGGNERRTNAGLALTMKVRIDDCFCVALQQISPYSTVSHTSASSTLTLQKSIQINGKFRLVNLYYNGNTMKQPDNNYLFLFQ